MKCLRCKEEMTYIKELLIKHNESFFYQEYYRFDSFECGSCGYVELKNPEMRK